MITKQEIESVGQSGLKLYELAAKALQLEEMEDSRDAWKARHDALHAQAEEKIRELEKLLKEEREKPCRVDCGMTTKNDVLVAELHTKLIVMTAKYDQIAREFHHYRDTVDSRENAVVKDRDLWKAEAERWRECKADDFRDTKIQELKSQLKVIASIAAKEREVRKRVVKELEKQVQSRDALLDAKNADTARVQELEAECKRLHELWSRAHHDLALMTQDRDNWRDTAKVTRQIPRPPVLGDR